MYNVDDDTCMKSRQGLNVNTNEKSLAKFQTWDFYSVY